MDQHDDINPSEELQEFMKLNGNLSYEDLASIDPQELLTFNGFNWRIMIEVLNFSEFDELQ